MAYGTELILGFGFPHYDAVMERMGLYYGLGSDDGALVFAGRIPIPEGVIPSDEQYEQYEKGTELEPIEEVDRMDDRLKEAHRLALQDVGFEILSSEDTSLVRARTPLGVREFDPFRLVFNFDPYEMEDTEETAVFGISVSSRYFPCFVDWKDPHGTIDPIDFGNSDLQRFMGIAADRIVEVIPEFARASWIVKIQHY